MSRTRLDRVTREIPASRRRLKPRLYWKLRLKHIAVILLAGMVAWFAAVAAPQAKRPSSKKSAAKSTSKKTAKKAGVSTKSKKGQSKSTVRARKAGSAAASKKAKAPASYRAQRQTQPSAERYREIQQALNERGYLKSEVNGKWDAESAEALRRFQQDQNLETTGKIDSLSLIALGLGPRRVAEAQPRPQ